MVYIYRFPELYEVIEYNKEQNPILNQIYDILADVQKQITLCKILSHVWVRENKKIDKSSKQAMHYRTIRMAKKSKRQREWEKSTRKLNYIKPHIEVSTVVVGNMRSNYVGSLLGTLDWPMET